MAAQNPRSRAWCFTSYKDEEPVFLPDKMVYIVYGREVCPKTGRKHLQGYVYYKHPRTMKGAIKGIGGNISVQAAKGSAEANFKYCSKDGDFVEHGTRPAQGDRTDLREIYSLIKQGEAMNWVADAYPGQYIRYHRGFEKVQKMHERIPHPEREPYVVILWGASGGGKTYAAKMKYKAQEISCTNKFWEIPDGAEDVYYDEFTKTRPPLSDLLKLLSVGGTRLNVKGGSVHFNPKTIYFIDTIDPKEWYEDPEIQYQFWRRVRKVIHFPDPFPRDKAEIVYETNAQKCG